MFLSLFTDLSNDGQWPMANDNQAKASVSPKDKTSTILNTKWTKKKVYLSLKNKQINK